ncbi:MAG: histidine--tRNA ligase [Deltaproteobacteria bacterium]|nr:histidine--tRNA ligase [Deltaproteobacteria bacterium]
MIKAVRGFKDILPEESERWSYVEAKAREVFTAFGFSEIRIPIVEKTDLFVRSIGETTDIVEKEMYTFTDRGDESLTLRPEATASVIRAYLEHSLYASDAITRLFAVGPMFRRERPQKGRYRQFNQINVELLGIDDPRVDAEVILMLNHFLKSVGVASINLQINSIGCSECRPPYRQSLIEFLEDKKDRLCDDCGRRLTTNPLRVFDCKNESCAGIIAEAPRILDFICQACSDHFNNLKKMLTTFGVAFEVNPKMVRGLDYYTKTTFEVTVNHAGSQNAIAGGGRYDRLVKSLGGPDMPGIGFGIGFERLMSVIDIDRALYDRPLQLFIAALGEEAQKLAYELCNRLRMRGIRTEIDYQAKSLKSQMKRADKLNSRNTLILGENELQSGKAQIRHMSTGSQDTVDLKTLEENILTIIKER